MVNSIENLNINEKCAPNIDYEKNGNTCLDDEIVIKIIDGYNEKNPNKQIEYTNKEDSLHKLKRIQKEKNKCSTDTCLVNKFIESKIAVKVLGKYFRPKGPAGSKKWLSTDNIDDVLRQYGEIYKSFYYLGTVPLDFYKIERLGFHTLDLESLYKRGKTKVAMVINLDRDGQPGSHWVALFCDMKRRRIYFFDSVGKDPEDDIRLFINALLKFLYMKKFNEELSINYVINHKDDPNDRVIRNIQENFEIRYNNIQHQFKNSECGVYSINFILRLLKGESFDSIVNNVTRDDEMKKCRDVYFNPENQ